MLAHCASSVMDLEAKRKQNDYLQMMLLCDRNGCVDLHNIVERVSPHTVVSVRIRREMTSYPSSFLVPNLRTI